jgi:sugar lactone lactonase YvrE
MRRLAHRASLGALLAAVSACAHAPARAPLPDVAWPEPPAAPIVRLVGLFPDPASPGPERSAWRRLLDAIAGAEPDERPQAWLARPFGVAAAADGSFVVADPDRPSVVRVGRGREERVTCRGREWQAPMAAAMGQDGALYVADGGAGEIVRVDREGRCTGLGAGSLERPTGLVAAADRIFVVDPPRHEVVVLSMTGAVLARFGTLGEGDGQLHFPSAITRALDGSLLVVDALNFRIARLSADGAWLGAFGAPGEVRAGLSRPKGIAVDEEGRVYVSDAQRDVVLVFSREGAFEVELGASGSEPGALVMPAGLAVAGRRLYVADSQNQRVQVFEILGGRP